MMHRFLVDKLDGPTVALPPGEASHAARVLRLLPGAEVTLFDGRGSAARGRIADVKRDAVTVAVQTVEPAQPRPEPIIHLGFAVPKGSRLDWLLEKATELGAASLSPVVFHRSVAGGGFTEAKRRRWTACCVAAAKQSGLLWLPELADPVPLAELLASPLPPLRLLGDASDDAKPLASVLTGSPIGNRRSVILVGPEGGLTDEERSACLAGGFVPVRVGNTVLRVETAAIALLAAAQAMLQDQGV